MSQNADYDVLISGAGMVGATLALALSQAGMRVLVVDPEPFEAQLAPTFDGRASAIAYSSFRQWRTLGLEEALNPVSQPIEQILVTDGQSPGASAAPSDSRFLRFDSEEIRDRSQGEPLGYMIENRQIRAAVSAALLASGAEVMTGVRVRGQSSSGSLVHLHLSDARTVTGRLAVGAEGRGHGLRALAGIGDIGWSYKQIAVVATVGLERPHQGVAHEYFLPTGPFAILPLTDNRASLVWTEAPASAVALAGLPNAAQMLMLRRRFGPFLGQLDLQGPVFTYPLGLMLAESLTGNRLALVGDAAHRIHPIAGQGLNLGLKDVAALAEVLTAAARRGEDIGSNLVLQRYVRWRRFDTMAIAASSDLFVRLFSNRLPWLRPLRGAGLALTNRIGSARRFFMQEAGGATGDLPPLFRARV